MGIRDGDIATLIATDSLRRLVTTYSRAVDRRDFDLLRSLYHDDADDAHGDMFDGGADAYVAFVEKALAAYEMTVHYVMNMNFVIDGDVAQGEIHKINWHRTTTGQEIVTGSRSLDHYARRMGEWRFSRRAITLDWARKGPFDPEAHADFAARSPSGRAGPDDLSYRLLDQFKRFSDNQ
ncbi:nuclear transport factor 2 family protein [Thalassorhabdomicrobium marinisediminis]|uniref:nuclear transport factor 2 family protein n=1 Tax=Thalassorhabdomicrobium marinisediminis TaxID=2170577 RepID=UPI002490A87E|nr:nuclear transport factor 2 family protein [Thalassorhabdomicrobium marinisediminis]